MFKRKILTLFKKGNVSICGLRGTGKDMLTANVIARRKRPYISNIDYNIKCKKATFNDLKLLQFDIIVYVRDVRTFSSSDNVSG